MAMVLNHNVFFHRETSLLQYCKDKNISISYGSEGESFEIVFKGYQVNFTARTSHIDKRRARNEAILKALLHFGLVSEEDVEESNENVTNGDTSPAKNGESQNDNATKGKKRYRTITEPIDTGNEVKMTVVEKEAWLNNYCKENAIEVEFSHTEGRQKAGKQTLITFKGEGVNFITVGFHEDETIAKTFAIGNAYSHFNQGEKVSDEDQQEWLKLYCEERKIQINYEFHETKSRPRRGGLDIIPRRWRYPTIVCQAIFDGPAMGYIAKASRSNEEISKKCANHFAYLHFKELSEKIPAMPKITQHQITIENGESKNCETEKS